MKLRAWQQEALSLFLEKKSSDFLAVVVTAAGKTTFGLSAASELMRRGEIRRVIVVTPTSRLRTQWAIEGTRHEIHLDSKFENRTGALAQDMDGMAVTYAAVTQNILGYRKHSCDVPTLVILDEVHHGGDELAWGDALIEAFGNARYRLLLTGTPNRTDGFRVPFVEYVKDDAGKFFVADFSYSYLEALNDEIVRPVAFHRRNGEVSWIRSGIETEISLAESTEQTRGMALLTAYSKGSWVHSALIQADKELSKQRETMPDAGALLIASDQDRACKYKALLWELTGEEPALAISDAPTSENEIERFTNGKSRWIIAVQMISEGIDIPRLVVGVYASRFMTDLFFRQVIGRFVRKRGNDDAATATILIPEVEPLLTYAKDFEETVRRALKEKPLSGEGGGGGVEPKNYATPLDSSDAIPSGAIISGITIGQEELEAVERWKIQSGLGPSVSNAALAVFLRVARESSISEVHKINRVQSASIKPKVKRKQNLRTEIYRKVADLAKATGRKHAHINSDLKKRFGECSIDVATIETLEGRIRLLDQWLLIAEAQVQVAAESARAGQEQDA